MAKPVKFTIRKTRPSDRLALAKILKTEFNRQDQHWTETFARARVRQITMPGHLAFTVTADHKAIGFISGEIFPYENGLHSWIHEFAIQKKYQNQGIGSQVIDFFEAQARKKGVKVIEFSTSDTQRAQHLYKRKKYRATAYRIYLKNLNVPKSPGKKEKQ